MSEASAALTGPGTSRGLPRPPPAIAYGIKYGVAASTALWLAYAAGLPEPTWAVITVIFICLPESGGSIQRGLDRIVGTLVAAFVSIGLYGLFAQQPALLLASMFLVWTAGLYGTTGPRHAYAWNVFAFTTGIILTDALAGVDHIETLAFERASLVAIGIVIVILCDAVFWPRGTEDSLRAALAERTQQLRAALARAVDPWLGRADPAERVPAPPGSPLAPQLALAEQVPMEIGGSRTRAAGLARVALLLEGLASRVRLLGRAHAPEESASAGPLRASCAELASKLDEGMAATAAALAEGRAPRPSVDELGRSLEAFEAERLRALGDQLDTASRASPWSSMARILADATTLVGRLEAALVELDAEGSRAPAGSPRGPTTIDRLRLERALRGSLAACASVVAMLVLNWPVSSVVPIIAFNVATSPTQGGMRKLARLLGLATLGTWALSDLAIVFLFPHLDRMPLALGYVLVLAGGAGTLSVMRPALAPLRGIVVVLAVLAIFGGPAKPGDVAGPYNTTVYVFLGIVTGLVAQRLLWPRSATQLFRARAAALLELCRRTFATQGVSSLAGEYGRQLAQLGPLHGQAQLEPVAWALDQERRAELLTLLQDVFDAALRTERTATAEPGSTPSEAGTALAPLRAALTRRDDALSASLADATRFLGAERGAERGEPSMLLRQAHEEVEAGARALRGQRELAPALGAERADALLAHLDAGRQLAESQLAVEAWLADWRAAATPGLT